MKSLLGAQCVNQKQESMKSRCSPLIEMLSCATSATNRGGAFWGMRQGFTPMPN